MKGLELSYQYYLEIGRPMLREKVSGIQWKDSRRAGRGRIRMPGV